MLDTFAPLGLSDAARDVSDPITRGRGRAGAIVVR